MGEKWNLEPNAVERALSPEWAGSWLVIRCGAKRTLKLALALSKRGVRLWTPVRTEKGRKPRSLETTKRYVPRLPSFLFVAEDDIPLVREQTDLRNYSIMRSYGVVVRIRNEELATLRKASDLKGRESQTLWPDVGSVQSITSGAFQGLTGRVVGKTQHHCLVDLEKPGFPTLKIPPFLLTAIKA